MSFGPPARVRDEIVHVQNAPTREVVHDPVAGYGAWLSTGLQERKGIPTRILSPDRLYEVRRYQMGTKLLHDCEAGLDVAIGFGDSNRFHGYDREEAIRVCRSLQAMLLMSASAGALQAQEAIGVPFVGKNHLSFYTTNVSRDGTGDQRAALYGGIYGRRFGDRTQSGEVSLSLRAGARAFEGSDDGIFDSGITLAATRSIPQLTQVSVTAAVGVSAMVWGQTFSENDAPETLHVSARVPVSAGLSYDLHIGAATFAPFATITPMYSSERDYVDEVRVRTDDGWKLGSVYGVTARFRETVFSISSIHHERGMPHANRIAFSAGMSW